MIWLQDIHLWLSLVLFVMVFVEGRDEPFWLRAGTATFVGLFWLPLLIIIAIWLIGDWAGDKVKGMRR
ncbi:hypothetical protein [Erythrobacter colymbi]|uniref:hypothetical protein n=1 Tax=Erythrobacter colymbi TaxID=1161202 RepID=UPI0013902C58|nr:hypothetical protein [Erythrobacter colymbi]